MVDQMSDSNGPCIPEDDWFDLPIPSNVCIENLAFLDTRYGLAPFRSTREPGLYLAYGSGAYDRTTFAVGPQGQVMVGAYSCLNGVYLSCEDRISIGDHCLIAWGVVICDTWPISDSPLSSRRDALLSSSRHLNRPLPYCGNPQPVTLEDNVWIGFGSVILPGVTLGRGCVIGCRSVIRDSVPAYAVVAGDPPRLLRTLTPTDSDPDQRQRVTTAHLRSR